MFIIYLFTTHKCSTIYSIQYTYKILNNAKIHGYKAFKTDSLMYFLEHNGSLIAYCEQRLMYS